jgi:hypothetical protein
VGGFPFGFEPLEFVFVTLFSDHGFIVFAELRNGSVFEHELLEMTAALGGSPLN